MEPNPSSPASAPSPEGSVTVFGALGSAFKVAASHLGSVALLATLISVPSSLVSDVATEWFQTLLTTTLPAHGTVVDAQTSTILAMSLAEVPAVIVSCLVAAFALPATYRIYLQATSGGGATLGDALNWGLLRWKQVFGWYLAATLIIWVGSIVIIPGIIYTIFYAFVPMVAALDPRVRRPLSRSTKLTRGRRGRIFRTFLVFTPWIVAYGVLGPLVLMGQPIWMRLLGDVVNEIISIIIGFCFLQYYQERMNQLLALAREKEAET